MPLKGRSKGCQGSAGLHVPIQKQTLVNTKPVSRFPEESIKHDKALTIVVNQLSYVNAWSFGSDPAQITIHVHFCLRN